MTALSVHSVSMLNIQDKKKGTYAQPFSAFWIFHNTDSGEKMDQHGSTVFVAPQYIVDAKKIWAGKKGGLLPSLSTGIFWACWKFFSIPKGPAGQKIIHYSYQNTALAPGHKYCVHPGLQHYCSIL